MELLLNNHFESLKYKTACRASVTMVAKCVVTKVMNVYAILCNESMTMIDKGMPIYRHVHIHRRMPEVHTNILRHVQHHLMMKFTPSI
jgi:hypothetical protein